MMVSGELLLSKGFRLNDYPEGKHYELEVKNAARAIEIADICSMDYCPEEGVEVVILQCREDFSKGVFYSDGYCWDLTEEEFERVINAL